MVNTDYKEVLDQLTGIKVQIGVLSTKVDNINETHKVVREELQDHGRRDNWINGFFLTVLLAILARLLVH